MPTLPSNKYRRDLSAEVARDANAVEARLDRLEYLGCLVRPNSNSHALCQEVAKGVKAAGNKAGYFYEAGAVKKTKSMRADFDLGRRI